MHRVTLTRCLGVAGYLLYGKQIVRASAPARENALRVFRLGIDVERMRAVLLFTGHFHFLVLGPARQFKQFAEGVAAHIHGPAQKTSASPPGSNKIRHSSFSPVNLQNADSKSEISFPPGPPLSVMAGIRLLGLILRKAGSN